MDLKIDKCQKIDPIVDQNGPEIDKTPKTNQNMQQKRG